MSFRTILIDDEVLAIKRLRRLLEPFGGVIEIIGEANDGNEALELIESLRPDLVFLDIQMPGMTGFEVLEKLEYLPLVIFSTAYDQYALKAFETNSIDYLLKPVDPERLEKAIDKLGRITSEGENKLRDQLKRMMLRMGRSSTRRIQVKTGDRVKFIDIEDIFFLTAGGKYVELFTADSSYLLTKTLKELEEELPPDDFVRIHRSSIINLAHVDEFARMFSGAYVARMKDKKKTELPVSRQSKGRLGLNS
ncbi:MAG: LytTR family DNA-binding domain-containing protein [Bacteroidales bacterium]|nr:LytTR family DNA-binding domain-containing protein [Candidatus Latescibacterota bacterium]